QSFTVIYDSINPLNVTDLNDSNYYYYEEESSSVLESPLSIMSLIVYSLAFLLGVTGNGLVIWITGFKMKKTVNTIWFLNLAIADFIFTFFLPLNIIYTALGFHWPFGRFMCKMNTTIAFLNMFASVYLLVVISIDRCISVIYPVWSQNHRRPRIASIISLVVWIVAFVLSSPYFAFRDTAPAMDNINKTNCYNNFAFSDDYDSEDIVFLRIMRHQAMVITRVILGFFVPFSIILVCYTIIGLRLKQNRLAKTSKPFKIIIAVIVIFFLCWAPYHIFGLLEMVMHAMKEPSDNINTVLRFGIPIATSLAFLNSCLNPILYVFMGHDFKETVKKSILSVLETAFTEESVHSTSTVNGRSKSKSSSYAEL
uniref:Formyl peptide receptor 1 n=1 Tax=Erpetoichthys calabaricus TaxID=27687 RepID=A0A8C4XI76_ERPCA